MLFQIVVADPHTGPADLTRDGTGGEDTRQLLKVPRR